MPAPPEEARTLVEVLERRAEREPGAVHLTLLGDAEGEESRLTYGELRAGAAAVAAGLRARGLGPGDTVALMLPTGSDFFLAFHGTLRAGGVPVPMYPPVRADQLEAHARRLAGILQNGETRFFVASPATRPAGRALQALVTGLEHVLTVGELRRADAAPETVPRGPGPGLPAVHLGHDRQPQGRDAHPRQPAREHPRDGCRRRGRPAAIAS
ncbi:MAG: AMP-binding protein [Halofilum sp. (in: g-proteobacteria)]|nr:AMP-binding protein [Halofilum sp. (in: g-proteobacteria)]